MADVVRTLDPEQWVPEITAHFAADASLSFDWLSACDEIGQADELRVVVRFDRIDGTGVRFETRVPRADPSLGSLRTGIPGAAWPERETSELYGITFTGHDGLPLPSLPLLLPAEDTPGHPGGWPLRKDFVLGARAVTPWPADEGGGEDGRRRQAPAGVPDPAAWGSRPSDAGPPDPSEVVAPPGRRRR